MKKRELTGKWRIDCKIICYVRDFGWLLELTENNKNPYIWIVEVRNHGLLMIIVDCYGYIDETLSINYVEYCLP